MNDLILFFDCFIISRKNSCEDTYTKASFPRLADMIGYRSASTTYKHVDKIEVVKYVLSSYQAVDWSHVYIRFECEDMDDTADFLEFCQALFPSASVVNQRSDTAAKWVAALEPLAQFGNPWVFFSPNNDHPLVGKPEDLMAAVELASEVERIYPDHIVSVLYSHWTESCSATQASEHDWGAHVPNFSSVIGETQVGRVVKNSRFMCDSIKVFRLDFLRNAFANTATQGRLIRLEETGLYLLGAVRELCIYPQHEICRHYDGYMHAIRTTPPLFIPDGFFEGKIKVRFGFEDHRDGWVNLHPAKAYSYLGGVADMRCLVSELPPFWKPRIQEVVYADDLPALAEQDLFSAQHKIRNPYSEAYFGEFYVQSAVRLMHDRGLRPSLSAISLSKKVLVAGESFPMQGTATGALVTFVESGLVEWDGLRHISGDYECLVPAQVVNCLAIDNAVLVIVRFD